MPSSPTSPASRILDGLEDGQAVSERTAGKDDINREFADIRTRLTGIETVVNTRLDGMEALLRRLVDADQSNRLQKMVGDAGPTDQSSKQRVLHGQESSPAVSGPAVPPRPNGSKRGYSASQYLNGSPASASDFSGGRFLSQGLQGSGGVKNPTVDGSLTMWRPSDSPFASPRGIEASFHSGSPRSLPAFQPVSGSHVPSGSFGHA